MLKVSVILYITIGIALLFLLSHHSPNNSNTNHHDDRKLNPHRRHGHRRLKLKSNFTFTSQDHLDHPDPHLEFRHGNHHEPVPFDPVVAEIERQREDRQWERMYFEDHHYDDLAKTAREAEAEAEIHHHHHHRHDGSVHEQQHHHQDEHDHHHVEEHAPGYEHQPEWEDFMDAEDYINDEDKFNLTQRLVALFPKVDVDPTDGYVTEKELLHWNLEQATREVLHRTRREMDLHDKNKDGLVSFAEYDPPSWVNTSASADNNTFGYDMGWWKEEHFNASDINGDGVLNITEFNDFLHPADTKNPKLLQWLCKEEVRERDTDKDGKVNFNEFFHGLFDLMRNYDEDGHNSTHHTDESENPTARKLFNELDKDGDGFLSDTELLAIIGKLHPNEQYYAKQQADYIISQADTNKDGQLTLAEMIENPYVFYSTMFDEDDDDYDYRDELR